MDPEFFIKMFAYHDWANDSVMDAAARLDEAGYRKDFGQAWGSPHGTLAHLLDAESVWYQRWHGTSPQGSPDGHAYASLPAIRAAWGTLRAERSGWLKTLTSDKLEAPLAYQTTSGKPYAEPLWQQMVQVVNHGSDHRGYLSIMLTELGVAPQPLDFIAYVRLASA